MSKKTDDEKNTLFDFLRTSNTMTRKSEVFFNQYKITAAQFNVLSLLEWRGGSVGQKQLVEDLLVGKASVSIVLKRMIRDGLITQKPDKVDLRKSIISLTSKGRKLQETITPKHDYEISRIFNEFTEDELAKFRKLLVKLDLSLQASIKE